MLGLWVWPSAAHALYHSHLYVWIHPIKTYKCSVLTPRRVCLPSWMAISLQLQCKLSSAVIFGLLTVIQTPLCHFVQCIELLLRSESWFSEFTEHYRFNITHPRWTTPAQQMADWACAVPWISYLGRPGDPWGCWEADYGICHSPSIQHRLVYSLQQLANSFESSPVRELPWRILAFEWYIQWWQKGNAASRPCKCAELCRVFDRYHFYGP